MFRSLESLLSPTLSSMKHRIKNWNDNKDSPLYKDQLLYIYFLLQKHDFTPAFDAFDVKLSRDEANYESKRSVDDDWISDVCFFHPSVQSTRAFSQRQHMYLRLLNMFEDSSILHVNYVPPVYLKKTFHNGVDIGNGLYAIVPFLRGQYITQFTGSVHPLKFGKRRYSQTGSQQRQNYCIECDYKGKSFCINPLIDDKTTVANIAAYINEPSPPSLAKTATFIIPDPDLVEDEDLDDYSDLLVNTQVEILSYDFRTGKYTVRFPDDQVVRVIPESLTDQSNRDPTYRANCMWFNFPVPIEMYDLHETSDPLITGRLKEANACLVEYDQVEALNSFDYITDSDGSSRYTPKMWQKLKPHDILHLKKEAFTSLHRQSIVMRTSSNKIEVRHLISNEELSKLPQTIRAGAYHKQAIPFPVIHACDDIEADRELLCLYAGLDASRGLPCKYDLHSNPELKRAEWSAICEQDMFSQFVQDVMTVQ